MVTWNLPFAEWYVPCRPSGGNATLKSLTPGSCTVYVPSKQRRRLAVFTVYTVLCRTDIPSPDSEP